MPPTQSKNWCFTLNNYTAEDEQRLRDLGVRRGTKYLIFGRECGELGTPHLQGLVLYDAPRRFVQVKRDVGDGAHIEGVISTPYHADQYCRKDGAFELFGEPPLPSRRGQRSDIADFRTWVSEFWIRTGSRPSERVIAIEHPSLFVRYRRSLLALADHLCPAPQFDRGELRPWQLDLSVILEATPDDRIIRFFVDEHGGNGKTWFCRYMLTTKPDDVQMMGCAKRDDMAHTVDTSKSIFLINVPRGAMEYFPYTICEQLKDRCVFSPKYDSKMKLLERPVHVVVFCNEYPDLNKMSQDRYLVKDM